MPFTVSHAAAVLPLRHMARGQLPLAALMIGSMSPDFSYFFIPGESDRLATHSIPGLFWFCLPVSIAAWLLFVRVLERPTLALLPEGWAARITPSSRDLTLRAFALASVAVILGGLTHIVWDSFTHFGSPVVDAIPGLRVVVFEYSGRPIRLYRLLQHLSSLFGMVILALWFMRLVRGPVLAASGGTPPVPPVTNKTRVIALAVILAASFTGAIASYLLHPHVRLERGLFHFAIGGMTGWMLAWIAIAIAINRTTNRVIS